MKLQVDLDDDGVTDIDVAIPCKGGGKLKPLLLLVTAIISLVGADWLL
jgi:hypothetical protein